LYQNGGNITLAEGVGGGTNMTSTTAPLPSSDATALYNKDRDLDIQAKYAEAITYLDKALDIDPNDNNALYSALSKMGR
jgi:tetratricopeptide (TPR) repeat protein